MNPNVLLELAKRWEVDAKMPSQAMEREEGNCEHARQEGILQGERQTKRECADMLRMLVSILGPGSSQPERMPQPTPGTRGD